ncbi:protein adenylyltransferase SelO [Simplicispira psychrophila]|uniref:protein adenylyltransferase SelO n=1 Tax=Simplicispira psychrophila TaxID=80882 RepID=UPI000481099E|nr:YdiU family protein [Simplicispira psychrophila]
MNLHVHDAVAADCGLAWNNTFSALSPAFFTRLAPTPLPAPHWVGRNDGLAQELGLDLDWFHSDAALQVFSGNQRLAGTDPLASVYSGHQFGVWAGQLGDGRAILLGETAAGTEVQLKGSGLTPYSRMGDGRAVLRSSIREFLCSEAMHALGIATTRALCVTGSPNPVRRETIETSAVVTRTAPSFIRFGHFEHFASRNQLLELRQLADYVIDRHYPACRKSSEFQGNAYATLLQAVSERTATLAAQWQAVGFCHGVLNTDNMSILGLTIDYGPFQFLDAFVPNHICNHSDTQGRYAFDRQPNVVYWNLLRLGQALQPLIGAPAVVMAALDSYRTRFPAEFMALMRAKLGLSSAQTGEADVMDNGLRLLVENGVDYTIFWRRLSHAVAQHNFEPVRDLFADRAALDVWLLSYQELLALTDKGLAADLMLKTNPRFILRNHLGEQAIRAAQQGDLSELQTLQTLLARPFDEHPGFEAYADFPPDWASTISISCSS